MIFCFSGTGNTRWAAERLAEATGERLTLMTDENTHCTLTPNERIGFCFPVHGWQPPRLVRNFIRRLTFSSEQPLASHYCYALVTCGDSIGLTMEMFNEDLEKKGLHASSTFSLVMPEPGFERIHTPHHRTPEKRAPHQARLHALGALTRHRRLLQQLYDLRPQIHRGRGRLHPLRSVRQSVSDRRYPDDRQR